MLFVTAMAVEELKEKVGEVLSITCKPEQLAEARVAVLKMIDACLQVVDQDARLESKAAGRESRVHLILREFELTSNAMLLLTDFYMEVDRALEGLIDAENLEAVRQIAKEALSRHSKKLAATAQ